MKITTLVFIFLTFALQGFKKPDEQDLKKKLTPIQYQCTQQNQTEKPFANPYWDHKEDGIYLDVVSEQPLFSSLDKYDSGTGWPSFTRPIEDGLIKQKEDRELGVVRTEIRSSMADSHLGHLFDDGPKDQGGKRYCVNSAAMKFVPLKEMGAKGHERFLFPFAAKKGWETAVVSGGCFWGVEQLIRELKGVLATEVGYTGGKIDQATYDIVKIGASGHAEAVRILFDPKETSYEKILLYFFRLHDPTTLNQQGNDKGTQYRSAIFVNGPKQKEIAQSIIDRVNKNGAWKKKATTTIENLGSFWRAEEYHQKYLLKTPNGYTCHAVREFSF